MKKLIFLLLLFACLQHTRAQQKTWCNPMNLDYGYCPIPNFSEWGKHRATADPVIVLFKGDYYLFSTNQWGYWWSHDLYNWHFVHRSFLKPYHKVYDDLCAPAAIAVGDTLLLLGSTHEKTFPIWMSTNPKKDEWKELVDSLQVGAWDPAFFLDDDNRLYLYWGSSNEYPIYGIELDRKKFQPIGTPKPLIHLNDKQFGWQRFGEYNDNVFLPPFIEGAWMNKHNGKYYLQYGAPGTEFSGYADGVTVGDEPLGKFTDQPHNPFSYKPGGFARGSGHGASFQDTYGNWWHVSTMVIAVKNNFERRLALFPAGFDKDGVLFSNTAFGDYPQYLPDDKEDHIKGNFTGWMLLNYAKPVTVSSTYGNYAANYVNDENIKTYWSASTGNKGEWITTDLGAPCTVHAIQINYADQDAAFMGKQDGLYHQYKLYQSADGVHWTLLTDKSNNQKDVPHDYIEFTKPVTTRFIKMENIHMPSGKFALSGLRVFGKGNGNLPDTVQNLIILRTAADKRSAWLKWKPVDNAYGYNIRFGVEPGKLYNSMMIYGSNEWFFNGMDKKLPYYFSIEALNENGISRPTAVLKAE